MTDPIAMIVERALAVGFLLIGVSHAAWPGRWGRLFADLFARREGALVVATLLLPVALLILFSHPAWTPDARSVVTLYAWLLALKCSLYLLLPRAAERLIPARVESGRGFRPVGCVLIVLGILVLHASYTEA